MGNEKLVVQSMNDLITEKKQSNVFREKLSNILSIPAPKNMVKNLSDNGITLSNANLADCMSASLVIQALSGNIAAYTTIRDTMGYKPIDQVKNDVVVRIDMSPQAKELGEW